MHSNSVFYIYIIFMVTQGWAWTTPARKPSTIYRFIRNGRWFTTNIIM